MAYKYNGWSNKIYYKKQVIEIYHKGRLEVTWTFDEFFNGKKFRDGDTHQFVEYKGTYGVMYDDILETFNERGINKDNTKEGLITKKVGKFSDFLDI